MTLLKQLILTAIVGFTSAVASAHEVSFTFDLNHQ
jgi:hypothetical protein